MSAGGQRDSPESNQSTMQVSHETEQVQETACREILSTAVSLDVEPLRVSEVSFRG